MKQKSVNLDNLYMGRSAGILYVFEKLPNRQGRQRHGLRAYAVLNSRLRIWLVYRADGGGQPMSCESESEARVAALALAEQWGTNL
jgi:hypothetical protein